MTQQSEEQEKYLQLAGGRTLAYDESGYPDSKEVVIFFHGVFGVGQTHKSRPPVPAFEEKKVHFIAPTLPGWGNSSLPPHSQSFRDYLYEAVATLINHLHPDTTGLRLYISGGSFGTVPAQMLYGAPYESFPLGRHIVGLLLLAPFSPPRIHKEFGKCLSWANWMGVGAPSQVLPGNLTLRLGSMMMKHSVNTPARAQAFIHDFGFKNMTPEERAAYDKWREVKGLTEDEVEKGMADGVYRSVQKTWAGFHATADVMHSDWGFNPKTLDDEHAKSPILVVATHQDKDTLRLGEWLVANYKNAHARYEEGGHIGSMFVMDDIWADFLGKCSA